MFQDAQRFPPPPRCTSQVAEIEEVFEQYERQVLRTAYRHTGCWEDARDVAQTVFLKLHGARVDGQVGGWLFRTTVNACNDLHRKRRPAQPLVEVAVDEPGPEELAAFDQQRRLLHEALTRLPERERLALTLREIEGLGTREVAARLGSTETTVRTQVSRAKVRLRLMLAAAALGILMVVALWPTPEAVPDPPLVTWAIPAPVFEVSRPKVAAPVRKRTVEPMTIKIVSDDEEVVIYWIVEAEGVNE